MPRSTNPLAKRRSISSPVSATKRSKKSAAHEDASERLDDAGTAPSLAPRGLPQDVTTIVRYVQSHMWAEVPDRTSGMGSERISDILRFREALPKIVSLAQLHALSSSPTETEREVAKMTGRGTARKVTVPGRGKGGTAVGDGVVLAADWKTHLMASQLQRELKQKYIELLVAHAASPDTPTTSLSDEDVRELVSAGYLTSPTALSSSLGYLFAAPGTATLSSLSLTGTTNATGTLAAVGGSGAVQESGGGGSALATAANGARRIKGQDMTFSLPGTGAYLKLMIAARQHLLALLKQISPRFKEATWELLKEKWEGNILNDATSRAKRARDEWSGVLLGKTKKWKDFYGLEFEWVLGECVGSGLVELFETGSVGWGVRAL